MAGLPFISRGRRIPRSKGEVAKDVGIKAGEKVAVGIVGCVPITIAVVIGVAILLIISTIGVLGHASEDPQFARDTGLDTVLNNGSDDLSPTVPPAGGVEGSPSVSPGTTAAPLSCSQVPGACKASCGDHEIEVSSGKCSTGICCARESNSRPSNFVFYCQWRPNWGYQIAHKGCVPTSIAMAMSSFGDTKWNPRTVAEANGCAGCYSGTGFSRFQNWIKSQGYSVSPNLALRNSFNVALARQYLARGYIIVAGANINSHSYNGGHEFVITSIDASGNASVLDPNFCRSGERGQRTFNVSRIGFPLLGSSPWGGAHAIKKI